jgi:NADH-quinone oxidoreductase subunit C
VYEPVEIEPRVLVPRVIRDDSRYKADDIDKAADDAAETLARGVE